MKLIYAGARFVALALLSALLLHGEALAGSGDETARVEAATEVLREIMAIPEKGIPPELFSRAEGVAVIPGVIKVGLGIGGRHGRGILVVKRNGSWSDPAFVSLTGGSIGWQIGAQSTDVILIFNTKKSIDGIARGKFTLGADASIAAGPVGRHAEMATDVELKAEILSYSRNRGLFAGIALEGAALKMDESSNEDYYGKKGLTAEAVFSGEAAPAPSSALEFKKLIEGYAGGKS